MNIERATQLLALLGGLWAIIAVVGGFFVSVLDTDAIAARLGFASQQQAINLASAIAELRGERATGRRPSVPQGAVIAFDLPISADTPEGCPVGWSPLTDLVGTMIVGADTARSNEFGYRAIGGEKEHALTEDELAAHTHFGMFVPCLSGCNPHPLYVGCAVIRQARVSEWKLMF